jgi:S1-C subfamily serine protease
VEEQEDWAFPKEVRAEPDKVSFDLERALSSIVSVRAEIPEDSFTAGFLGTERTGNGIIIDPSGLVLTIGYLIAEASDIWLTTGEGDAVRGHLLAYDYDSGFGIIQSHTPFDVPIPEFGAISDLLIGSNVVVAGHGGLEHCLSAQLVGKREFAGYWEYVLDEALFTVPAHPNWGGAALFGPDGKLYGVGSLYVENARSEDVRSEGNMLVPIDLLTPILDDLIHQGSSNSAPRPWLGLYASLIDEKIVVVGLAEGGPAHNAGVRTGDIILTVAEAPIGDLADFFRTIWDVGPAGTSIALGLWRAGDMLDLSVASINRDSLLRSPRLH